MNNPNLFQMILTMVRPKQLTSVLSKSTLALILLLSLLGTNVMSASANADQAARNCFTLTLKHTGTGNNPSAQPSQSAGCPLGKYKAGEKITLTAKPATGWEVGSWTGTDDDLNKTTTNVVTMTAKNRRVFVNYVLACYSLTLSHTGEGLDPTAQPANSAGCALGEYHSGESVSFTASPATGWAVLNWSGTANDASSSLTNMVTIPNKDHTVSVNYQKVCFALTLTHTGNGSNPVPTPASSADCASGEYRSGELITLSSTPDSGWSVGSWVGTDNNTSVAVNNQLTMPNGLHTVTVNYVEEFENCYYLTVASIGADSDPVPSPIKSESCANDHYYAAGETVNFTAAPPAGYVMRGWHGSDNDSLTSTTNTWTMTAENHVVIADYAKILSASLKSVGSLDGWVLESTEFSLKGGTINSTASAFYVGDDVANRQYRGILSFNTANLPDNVKILSITLKVRRQGLVGTNPFATHGRLLVDIREPKFGTSIGLQAMDFQAAASKNAVGIFGKPTATGWYQVKLGAKSFPFINPGGATQFRLRFSKDDNNDHGADYLKLYSGNAGASNRPMLIVTYYIP